MRASPRSPRRVCGIFVQGFDGGKWETPSSSRCPGAHPIGLVATLLCSRHSAGGFGGVSAGTAGGVASWDAPAARGAVVVFFFSAAGGSHG